MPRLVKLYIRQVLIGFGLSAAFVTALLWQDVAGLRHLIAGSPDGALALFLLFMFNGIVFAGVQFAITIMRMGESADDDDRGRRAPEAVALPAPVAVPVEPAPAPRR